MSARVDKTESAIGVTRGTLLEDIDAADWNKPIAVGINASGLTVKGGGTSGVIAISIFDRTNFREGTRADMFGNGTEVVGCEGLTAGTKYYAEPDGDLSATAAGNTYVGFTVEADRLVVVL